MLKSLFSDNPTVLVASAALIFFFLLFVGAVVWVMSRRRSKHYEHMASLPLSEGPLSEADR